VSDETIDLDFSDVQEFAPFARNVEKGDYLLKVQSIKADTSNAGNPMWVVDAVFVEGRHQGETIREYLALTENALFKVKSWLEALGKNVGKKKVKLPNTTPKLMKAFAGKTYGAHIDEGDPYVNNEGEEVTKSEVKYHLKPSEVRARRSEPSAEDVLDSSDEEPEDDPLEDEPEEEPKPKKKATKKAAKKKEPEPEPEEEDTPEDDDDDDAEEGDVADQLEDFDLDDI